jgi:hypothetical protein
VTLCNNRHNNNKKKLAEAYTHLASASASTWPTPFPSLAYINWFGLARIHDLLFFSLFSLWLSSVCYHSSSSVALAFQSSICTSIIMLRFIIRTYTLCFLGQLVRTTYTRTCNRSRLDYRRFNMLHISPFPLPALVLPISFQCTVRSYTLSRTILYYRYSYMLS